MDSEVRKEALNVVQSFAHLNGVARIAARLQPLQLEIERSQRETLRKLEEEESHYLAAIKDLVHEGHETLIPPGKHPAEYLQEVVADALYDGSSEAYGVELLARICGS
ncbi:hypothetical protein HDV00_007665 [Rhizophlyctis rosea]|nr:hypothetical protein HDV00_007665 [Rhizophlyctis rosea]